MGNITTVELTAGYLPNAGPPDNPLTVLRTQDHAEQLSERARPHLVHDVRPVGLHGFFTDPEGVRDLFAAKRLDEQVQHLAFTWCEAP